MLRQSQKGKSEVLIHPHSIDGYASCRVLPLFIVGESKKKKFGSCVRLALLSFFLERYLQAISRPQLMPPCRWFSFQTWLVSIAVVNFPKVYREDGPNLGRSPEVLSRNLMKAAKARVNPDGMVKDVLPVGNEHLNLNGDFHSGVPPIAGRLKYVEICWKNGNPKIRWLRHTSIYGTPPKVSFTGRVLSLHSSCFFHMRSTPESSSSPWIHDS